MKIEISQQAFQAFNSQTHDIAAFVEAGAKQRNNGHEQCQRLDPKEVLAEFKKLEGIFGDATMEEVLADRRYSIHW